MFSVRARIPKSKNKELCTGASADVPDLQDEHPWADS